MATIHLHQKASVMPRPHSLMREIVWCAKSTS